MGALGNRAADTHADEVRPKLGRIRRVTFTLCQCTREPLRQGDHFGSLAHQRLQISERDIERALRLPRIGLNILQDTTDTRF